MDIARSLDVHGFGGEDSASLRTGGRGDIVAAVEAFNQGFIAGADEWRLLNGYNPRTFSMERAEAAGQTPINNRVVVRAPLLESDGKNLMGLYYINRCGAWYFAGLKVYRISRDISWWQAGAGKSRIDLDNLHRACGLYWAQMNRVVWSVPMIVNGDSQQFNNRLISYDLSQGVWLPPMTISAASLCTAYHISDSAPGKLGPPGIYGGDYYGRLIRLFGPDDSTDNGERVSGWVETGRLSFGSPDLVKLIRTISVYGKAEEGPVTIDVFSDGSQTAAATLTFDNLSGDSSTDFVRRQVPLNIRGRFFKFRIAFEGVAQIHGLQAGVSVFREWDSMS